MVDENNLLQLKVTLEGIKPPVWRRLAVPADMTFHELHSTLQIAFGWEDSHTYEFRYDDYVITLDPQEAPARITDPIPNELDAATFTLAEVFPEDTVVRYIYDFGDDWRHKIQFERYANGEKLPRIPFCTAGARRCPPEDVGGVPGYAAFLAAPENAAYDAERFDKDAVNYRLCGVGTPPVEAAPSSERDASPTRPQWQRLFDLAQQVHGKKPWTLLKDTDLIRLDIQGQSEPVFVCTMGQSGDSPAVGIFPGFRSLLNLLRMANADPAEPWFVRAHVQNCVMCYFGNREEVQTPDRAVYEQLGLKFRGKGNLIYFRRMEPGYFPWYITADEAELAVAALQGLLDAIASYGENPAPIGKANVLAYQNKQWGVQKMSRIPSSAAPYIWEDEVTLERLRQLNHSPYEIDLDSVWLPMPIQDNPQERPYFPKMILLSERDSRLFPLQHLMEEGENETLSVWQMLHDYALRRGLPKAVHIRGEGMLEHLSDICRKLGVSLVMEKRLPDADHFLKYMLDNANQ